MKVLVACEYSARVRDAFRKFGHDAWSCDLLECEGDPAYHIQGDCLEILNDGWDLMIGHPPCQYLSYAGMASWKKPGRKEKRDLAMEFFMRLYNSPIRRICIENPRGLPCQSFRKPDQVIHPWYFGENEMKRTCLWLKNLPLLEYTLTDGLFYKRTAAEKPKPIKLEIRKATGQIKKRYFCDSQIRKNWKERSRTFQGIADAMAEQWGKL